jgi:hypothetical protein
MDDTVDAELLMVILQHPLDSEYSGVGSIRGFRLAIFLAELSQVEIGNVYFEAYSSEKGIYHWRT